MVEAFDMLVEYDSGMVFEDYKVPMGDDLRSFEEFFYLKRQPLGEFVIVLKEGGLFYFLSDHFVTLQRFVKNMTGMSFHINHSISNLKSVSE